LQPPDLEPGKIHIEALIPHRAMGDRNSIHDLQNYVAGPSTVLNYFSLLANLRVKNNVQAAVGPKPIDLIVARLESSTFPEATACAVYVYADEDHQAVLLAKNDAGKVLIRYLPVAHLVQSEAVAVTFEPRPWAAGFPLDLFEDENLAVSGDRAEWLSAWHTDSEWLEATHRTAYSNGIVGLVEHFWPVELGTSSPLWNTAGPDAKVLRRFELRKRKQVEADLLILAANHWNFNVRGFNPGGNHGSFFRISTNSTLMLTGAGIPAGLRVEKPYDSLSFMPTMLELDGLPRIGGSGALPGPVIQELIR
jgi:hypothetical protein